LLHVLNIAPVQLHPNSWASRRPTRSYASPWG
jgi:hypothetical protein